MTQAAQLAQYGSNNVGLSFKNRIINGDMTIDQRNAGALNNPAVSGYTVDRWNYFQSQTSKGTIGQDAGAVTPPVGFNDYLGFTSTSAYSINSTDQFLIQQAIEGFNVADFGWGTANAQTVTLSFWVRSSLTGTFGGVFQNSASNRNYPFSYTISAANTWEQKSITVAGDTAGTWLTTNGAGIKVIFSLGTGSTYSATAGAWTGSSFISSATGATSVVGTSGATFYITGVQLEKGSVATSFDYLPYGTELMLCQRYFQVIGGGPPDSSPARNEVIATGMQFNSTEFYYQLRYIQEMRAFPSFTLVGNVRFYTNGTSATRTTIAAEGTSTRTTRLYVVGSGGAAGDASWLQMGGFENDRLTASAEL